MSNCIRLRKPHSRLVEIPVKSEISLTIVEDQICTLLDECTQKLKEEKGIITSCRIAGGWVRDKLLGLESNDIDIALTDMMGYPFAEQFVSFVESKNLPIKDVVKIASNPDQSKHLETARTTVLGIELDFVNLRSEEYADDSRIPTEVTFGTPLQDALRRDMTINTLFYNVHSRTVEDFTEKGLSDLRNGIIRTPLTPNETFRDDPLRVIRCVRFASRFGFDLVEELQKAARDPTIQEAISTKLSRERVGEEINKMMKGHDPFRAIQLIDDLSLSSALFSMPPSITSSLSDPPAPFATSLAAATIFHGFLHPPTTPLPSPHPTLLSYLDRDPSSTARLFLATALTQYRNITYLDSKKKSHLAVEAAIRDGLKLGTQSHYLDGIPQLFVAANLLKNPDQEVFRGPSERVAIGLLLRDKSVHNPNTGSHWTTSLLFSLVQELVTKYDTTSDTLNVQEATNCINMYNAFVSRIEELKLPASVDAKSILDGREVVDLFDAGRGPWVGPVLAKVIEWQLQHPDGAKDDCVEWLKIERSAGRIQVDAGPPTKIKR